MAAIPVLASSMHPDPSNLSIGRQCVCRDRKSRGGLLGILPLLIRRKFSPFLMITESGAGQADRLDLADQG
ncbi:hypothetical protein VTK26DRAFT_4484 [Humicola hyalothermophila]